jgi:hypothetical protein
MYLDPLSVSMVTGVSGPNRCSTAVTMRGGFWCLVERFVFKTDLANCQPASAPLELQTITTISGKGNVLRIMTTTTATSRSSARAGATSSLAASAKFKSFAIAFGISVPIVYFGCEMFNLPAFTYHPATNRVSLGWEAGRSGEGPAMYWYGWTGVTLVAGFILGLLATLLPEGVVKKIPLALLWLLPILALLPLAYSLMPFWTK